MAEAPIGRMRELIWRCRHFDELSVGELDAIYRARQLVFVMEQACPYLDADGCDARSMHLAAWDAADSADPAHCPHAYARIVAPGVKYDEPSIGRVLTLGAARGTGLGRELVRRAVAGCLAAYPHRAIRISAQHRLEAFYAEVGFASVGEPYLEDNIPHIEMLLPSASGQGAGHEGAHDL